MPIATILGIAGSALTAQSQRITLIAQNLANVDSVQSPDGGPYQRRLAVFEAAPLAAGDDDGGLGVRVASVLRDQSAPKAVYDPSNPYADAAGMVETPAVNQVDEMVDMMQAARSYQANLAIVETARTAAMETVNLLK
ncbi:MAG: flagellar basal body rod protein FlgC [Candidatus Binataceae bacterium]